MLWAATALGETVAFEGAVATSHMLEVTVDGNKRLRSVETWTVRIDDPSVCTSGIPAPVGMEGASEGESVVADGLLKCAAGTETGAELVLTQDLRERSGPYRGHFINAPGIKTERTEVKVVAPTWMPLASWADGPTGREAVSRGGYGLSYTWGGRPIDRPAQVVWSTYAGWDDLSSAVNRSLRGKISDAGELGELGTWNEASIEDVAAKVYAKVPLSDTGASSWEECRSAAEILTAGEAVSVWERSIVLVAALRAAGFEAEAAQFDPVDTVGAPISLVDPNRLAAPAVAVGSDFRPQWIDPAAIYAPIPEAPLSMRGKPAWRVGDHAVRVPDFVLDHGEVAIRGKVTFEGVDASFKVEITGTGATREYLRELMAPLDDAGRTALIKEMLPEATEILVGAKHVSGVGSKVSIVITGKLPAASTLWGVGIQSTFKPLLAPEVAGRMPGRVRVREELELVAPAGLDWVASTKRDPVITKDLLVFRSIVPMNKALVLTTQIERTGDREAPSAEVAAELTKQAGLGPKVYAVPPGGKALKSPKKDTALSKVEKVTMAASILAEHGKPEKAAKLFAKTLKRSTPDEVTAALTQTSLQGSDAVWSALYGEVAEPYAKLAVLEEMDKKGLTRQAWQLSTSLTRTEDQELKRRALLAVLKYQGDKPDPAVDLEASKAWIAPKKLIKAAYKIGEELGAQDPTMVALTVEDLLVRGRAVEAREILTVAEEEGITNGLVAVLLADADAVDGRVVSDVLRALEAATEQRPTDPEVFRNAARTAKRVRRPDLAVQYAAQAARLAFDDPHRWIEVLDYALESGDLTTAVEAARHASDPNPDHRRAGIRLKLVALSAGDIELSNIGARRGRQAPETMLPELQHNIDRASDEAQLSLLLHHDGQVVKSPELLAKRAEMLLRAHRFDEAYRDGWLLLSEHNDRAGYGVDFAARRGTHFVSPAALRDLNNAVGRSDLSRTVRMEWNLLALHTDPLGDAYRLKKDPRAQQLARSKSRADEVAKQVPGWESDKPDLKVKAPSGDWRTNYAAGRPTGIVAYSEKVTGSEILILSQTLGLIPGPVGVVFEQPERPVYTRWDGANVYQVRSSLFPCWAALLYRDEGDLVGLGPTEEDALWALDTAVSSLAEE